MIDTSTNVPHVTDDSFERSLLGELELEDEKVMRLCLQLGFEDDARYACELSIGDATGETAFAFTFYRTPNRIRLVAKNWKGELWCDDCGYVTEPVREELLEERIKSVKDIYILFEIRRFGNAYFSLLRVLGHHGDRTPVPWIGNGSNRLSASIGYLPAPFPQCKATATITQEDDAFEFSKHAAS